jgi:hypothetical protein
MAAAVVRDHASDDNDNDDDGGGGGGGDGSSLAAADDEIKRKLCDAGSADAAVAAAIAAEGQPHITAAISMRTKH